jgi:hypothetical protein
MMRAAEPVMDTDKMPTVRFNWRTAVGEDENYVYAITL